MTKRLGQYFPVHDARHRHACLTLYRHLLLLANKVPLPSDLPAHPSGPRSPLAHQVRKAFARNRPVTSPRLLLAAFRNGYKGLAILKEATDVTQPRHGEVIDYLRSRFAEAHRSRAAHSNTPTQLREMKADGGRSLLKRPILKRVFGRPPLPESAKGLDPNKARNLLREDSRFVWDGESFPNPSTMGYYYERATPPVPKEELGGSGRRHVPHVDHAYEAAPFLRYKKPQPRVLTHILRSKGQKWLHHADQLSYMESEMAQSAKLEDEWDYLTGEAPSKSMYRFFDESLGEEVVVEPFHHSVKLSRGELHEKLVWLRNDSVLRTQALVQLVEEERMLAKKEKRGENNEKGIARLVRKQDLAKAEEHRQNQDSAKAEDLKKRQAADKATSKPAKKVGGGRTMSAAESLRQTPEFDEFERLTNIKYGRP